MNTKGILLIVSVVIIALVGYVAYDYTSSKNVQVADTREAVEQEAAQEQTASENVTELSGVGTLVPDFGAWKSYRGIKDDFTLYYPSQFNVERKVSNVGDAVTFTFPKIFYAGTNLSSDTSFQVISNNSTTCKASEFATGDQFSPSPIGFEKEGIKYDGILTAGAAAGNRYQEYIFSTTGRIPCFAIRYYIHSTTIENYPSGTVKAFDDKLLMKVFGQMLASFKPLK